MTPRPATPGRELGAVDWSYWSVVLLKPDCIRQNLTEPVLDRLATAAEIVHHTVVTAEDWQVFVHYWDLLVDRHSLRGWSGRDRSGLGQSGGSGHQRGGGNQKLRHGHTPPQSEYNEAMPQTLYGA